jgi:hypothetical protein
MTVTILYGTVTILCGEGQKTTGQSRTMDVDIKLNDPVDSTSNPPETLSGSFIGSGVQSPVGLDELWPKAFAVKMPQFDVWYDGE